MHDSVERESRARRKRITDSEGSEMEGELRAELGNFQDLQLGSITPVVCRKDNPPPPSLT